MTNNEKKDVISRWIDPEERVTVQFLDAQDLNTEVTGCTEQLVDLSIETHVSHMKQHLSLPPQPSGGGRGLLALYTRSRSTSSTKPIDVPHQRKSPPHHLLENEETGSMSIQLPFDNEMKSQETRESEMG